MTNRTYFNLNHRLQLAARIQKQHNIHIFTKRKLSNMEKIMQQLWLHKIKIFWTHTCSEFAADSELSCVLALFSSLHELW